MPEEADTLQLARGEPVSEVINRADACLYAAKHAGRNREYCENDLGTVEAPEAAAL